MSVIIHAVSQLHKPKDVDLNKSGLVTICTYRNVLKASDNGVLQYISLTECNSGTIKRIAHFELILQMSSKYKKLHPTIMASGGTFQITSVPVLLDVAVTFFRSVVV